MTRTDRWGGLALGLLGGALLLAVVGGCLPGAAWLPDSSGFVFVAPRTGEAGEKRLSLYRYDLAAREKRVLVDDLQDPTLWPAVSPDGRRIAVASIRSPGENMASELELRFYDLHGKLLETSPKFSWGDKPTEENSVACGLYWVGPAKKILVYDYEGEGHTGIYDLATRHLTLLDGLPISIAGSPGRPDAAGFLLARKAEGSEQVEILSVDWRGEGRTFLAEAGFFIGQETTEALQLSWLGLSRWEGPVAEIRYAGRRLLLNVEKLTASAAAVPDAKQGEWLVHWEYAFPNGGARLRVLKRIEGGDQNQQRLELARPGEPGWKTLQAAHEGPFVVVPAPNHQAVVVRFGNDEGRLGRIFVVQHRGEQTWVQGQ